MNIGLVWKHISSHDLNCISPKETHFAVGLRNAVMSHVPV